MNYGCQSMVKKIDTILIKRPENAYVSQENLAANWEAFKYFGCPDFEQAKQEYDSFEAIIRANVPNVYTLPYDARGGLDSIYTHDPVKITEKGAIYFPMGKDLRSKEFLATEEFLKSQGVPTLGYIQPPGKMEGGDVLWIDERTVAIGLGYRTNSEGIRQFKELTKGLVDEYIIVPMPYADGPEACLHLMSIVSFVDTDKAVVYSKYMPVFFRNYLLEKGFELIECGDAEYDYLGTNLLALEPKKCVLIQGCPEIQKKLEEKGIEVLTYKGHEISYKGTGGPTCLTCPVCRK